MLFRHKSTQHAERTVAFYEIFSTYVLFNHHPHAPPCQNATPPFCLPQPSNPRSFHQDSSAVEAKNIDFRKNLNKKAWLGPARHRLAGPSPSQPSSGPSLTLAWPWIYFVAARVTQSRTGSSLAPPTALVWPKRGLGPIPAHRGLAEA